PLPPGRDRAPEFEYPGPSRAGRAVEDAAPRRPGLSHRHQSALRRRARRVVRQRPRDGIPRLRRLDQRPALERSAAGPELGGGLAGRARLIRLARGAAPDEDHAPGNLRKAHDMTRTLALTVTLVLLGFAGFQPAYVTSGQAGFKTILDGTSLKGWNV